MPTISMFRGIKIFMNWQDHKPPHIHAVYSGQEVLISIKDFVVLAGSMPSKQLHMVLGWTALHQEELLENWKLAETKQELFAIEPLK